MASIKKSVYEIIRRPVITEKTTLVKAANNQVVFEVFPSANKMEIKNAVEKIFDVKVEAVRVMNAPEKPSSKKKIEGKLPVWKKAYVSLAEGSSIEIVEGL